MAAPIEKEAINLQAEAKKLRRHFQFTEADLAENRKGVLSEKQRERLRKNERGGQVVGALFGLLLLVFAGVFAAFLPTLFRPASSYGGMVAVWVVFVGLGVILGLLGLALAGGGLFLIVSQFLKSKKLALVSVRGRARLQKWSGKRTSQDSYSLYIDELEFDGTHSMPNAIIEGAEYIVYYLDGVDEIQSVELVSDGTPAGGPGI
jgi:hypothetical protein